MQEQKTDMISLTKEQLQKLLEDAAKEGVKQLFLEVGLDDEQAWKDLREAGQIVRSFRMAKTVVIKKFWTSALDYSVKFIIMLFLAWAAVRCGFELKSLE